MPETFNPLQMTGGPACVQALRELEIRISQRLGARLHALGRRGIQLSPALLESAAPGSPLEAFLLDDRWTVVSDAAGVAELLNGHQIGAHSVLENGVIKVVAADEISSSPQLAASAEGSLLPALLGGAPTAAAASPLWDRLQMEQAALSFLDSEDATELVEKLRYLFRATVASRLDPTPLLRTALRRGKSSVALEAATLIRDHLDRDLGRALEDLFSADAARLRDAIHDLLRNQESETLRSLILPALTHVLSNPQALRWTLPLLDRAVPLASNDADVMEPFLDALMRELDDLEAAERFALSRFLLAVQPVYPDITRYLYRRLRASSHPHVQAFYGNVLSRMQLQPQERDRVSMALVEVFLSGGNDVALQERFKVTFMNLGAEPLRLLTDAERLRHTNGVQRTYLADLWAAYLAADAPHPPLQDMAAFLTQEIAARNRPAVMCMIRNGLLHHPALAAYLQHEDGPRHVVVNVLLEEAVRLEEPDDAAVIGFLAGVGWEAVEAAFERVREEAALESRSAPYRFRLFAHLAAGATLSAEQRPATYPMVEQCLGFPFVQRCDLPVTLEGLGVLSGVPDLPDDLADDILERILPSNLQELAGVKQTLFPQQRIQAALTMYRGDTCPQRLRSVIEQRLEGLVAAEQPPRVLLVPALAALETLMTQPRPPERMESICMQLARTVLRKSREASLDSVLQDMLKEDTEGLGVRVPQAWGKEDRDQALIILGKAAARPDTAETLHRMITARLAGFLEDWLDAQEAGRDVYTYRDTPLWGVLVDLVRGNQSEHAVEAVVRIGLRAMEAHRKVPEQLALERREDAQRLVAQLIWLAPQQPVEVRGSMRLDIPSTALQTLLGLASRDNQTSMRVLEEVAADGRLPQRFKAKLDSFFTFQARRPPA